MGRELKRVALDFTWPIGQLWKGFINPYRSQDCKACEGSGLNPATKRLSDEWYGNGLPYDWQYPNGPDGRRWNNNAWHNHITDIEVKALVEAGRLMDFTRVPRNEQQVEEVKKKVAEGGNSWLPYDNGYIPTAEEVNEWNKQGMGHDSINRHICVMARAEHLGVYGECEYCKGEGEIWANEELKALHDSWEDYEPPIGEGYQLWSTTTEGHPMTPVFETLDKLCEYCEAEKVSVFGHSTATKEEWKNMLNDDLVCYKEGNMIFI